MSNHTPGPWRTDATCGGLAIESEKHGNIGLVNLARASTADARLIAAAPDMLAALRKAERLAWEVGCETVDGVNVLLEDERSDLWREISAAIAKATEASK